MTPSGRAPWSRVVGLVQPESCVGCCDTELSALARIGESDEPSKRIRCTGNYSAEDQQIAMQSVQNKMWKRREVSPTYVGHDRGTGAQKMPRRRRRGFDPKQSVVDLASKAALEVWRNCTVLLGEPEDILRKIGVVENLHPIARRKSSSDKPRVVPVTTSSMRRTPSATNSHTRRSLATLSTIRRASSRRSFSGSANTDSVI